MRARCWDRADWLSGICCSNSPTDSSPCSISRHSTSRRLSLPTARNSAAARAAPCCKKACSGESVGSVMVDQEQSNLANSNIIADRLHTSPRTRSAFMTSPLRIAPFFDANTHTVTYLAWDADTAEAAVRSEEHTSELQSPCNLVCRLLLEKKKNNVGMLVVLVVPCGDKNELAI